MFSFVCYRKIRRNSWPSNFRCTVNVRSYAGYQDRPNRNREYSDVSMLFTKTHLHGFANRACPKRTAGLCFRYKIRSKFSLPLDSFSDNPWNNVSRTSPGNTIRYAICDDGDRPIKCYYAERVSTTCIRRARIPPSWIIPAKLSAS